MSSTFQSSGDYNMIFKILLIGDSGVGKTNILLRYVKNEFKEDLKSTVGAEFSTKLITLPSNTVKIQIWDTAGQERFRSITSTYYKGAKGALVVFDLTKESSLNNTVKWLTDFKAKSDENSMCILVGNKSDLTEERVVTKETAQKKAEELGLPYFETSAKNGEFVEDAFVALVNSIIDKCNSDNKKVENDANADDYKGIGSGIVIDNSNNKVNDDGKDSHNGNNNEKKKEKKCCGF